MTVVTASIDLSLASEEGWQEAEQRAVLIRPLALMERCPRDRVVAAADDLGISVRQVYRLIKRCRAADGALTSLLRRKPTGGQGGSRLATVSETLLRKLIEDVYLERQRVPAETLVREVRRACATAQIYAPSASTIRRRLAQLSLKERRKRGEAGAVRPIVGATPEPRHPFKLVQMDHTKVDLILVDAVERKPIGRPWITVGIDVFSRCIAGFHLSLEAPSSTSVGLCLTRMATDKASWLTGLDVEVDWPTTGIPGVISVDNAREFHGQAFERGCAQHGIEIDWRPHGQPHFGGVVERVIGTLMALVHELPGTTFSNPVERGRYDSDKTACLTLAELERWFAVAIAKVYHLRPHEGLDGETPLARWRSGIEAMSAEGQALTAVHDPTQLTIDFLPVAHRTLRRTGIVMDHITYFSDALKPWIEAQTPRRVLIRRDPRDLSRIHVLDPMDNSYLEVPYRDRSHPPITLWEHKIAVRRLREQRRAAVDEPSLFAAVEEMRVIEASAKTSTRATRRNQARRASLRVVEDAKTRPAPEAPSTPVPPRSVTPFDVEEW